MKGWDGSCKSCKALLYEHKLSFTARGNRSWPQWITVVDWKLNRSCEYKAALNNNQVRSAFSFKYLNSKKQTLVGDSSAMLFRLTTAKHTNTQWTEWIVESMITSTLLIYTSITWHVWLDCKLAWTGVFMFPLAVSVASSADSLQTSRWSFRGALHHFSLHGIAH